MHFDGLSLNAFKESSWPTLTPDLMLLKTFRLYKGYI